MQAVDQEAPVVSVMGLVGCYDGYDRFLLV